MITPSEFINSNIDAEKVEKIETGSKTSQTFKLCINGQLYFMKKLRPEYCNDPRYRRAFIKEYESGKSIIHPNIVKYTDINDDKGDIYILMEYVNGYTLKEKIENEPEYFQSNKRIEKLLLQLCLAIQTLHNNNIIYLDLSPKNILLTKTTNDLKLIDLGFCINNNNDYTAGCTPGFTAPEVSGCDIKEIDARTDIYTIGCILRYIEEKRGKKLSRKLQRIKERCIKEKKAERYTSSNQIIADIKNKKRNFHLAAAAIIATIALFFSIEDITNYIAWETGKTANKFEVNGIAYQITSHKARTVEVTYKGSHPDECKYERNEINIPSTVNYRGRNFNVTSIAGQAFKSPYISKINIPDGIITLSDSAFFGCQLADTIYIPKSVKSIGPVTIYPKCHIKGYVVDAENTYYDSRNGCNAIIESSTNTLIAGCESTVIPEEIVAITATAFIGVEKLEHINLPDNINEIGGAAFVLSKIKEIAIPEGITELKPYTFQYCEELKNITLPQSLSRIGVGAISHCALNKLTIPDNVTFIDDYAFDCNERLCEVSIGKGVRHIGYAAFENCNKLNSIVSHIPGDSLFEIPCNTFQNINKECVLYVPLGAKSKYKNTFGWDVFTRIIELSK